MSGASKAGPRDPEKLSRAQQRDLRLKRALKANIGRRKARGQAMDGDDEAGETGPDNEQENE